MSATAEKKQYVLTLPFYMKTAEGQAMVESQRPFVIGGLVYQGYNRMPVDVAESQLSDEEILEIEEEGRDVDGTLDKVLFVRRQRLESRELGKAKEAREKAARKRAELRDELQLRKLQQEMGDEPTGTTAEEKPQGTGQIECQVCHEMFGNLRQMRGHMMGKHGKRSKSKE